MRASTMQLERREAFELVLSFRASLLSEVATRLFDLLPASSTGSKSKTNEVEKSYKRSGTLNQKHRGRKSCGKEEIDRIRAIGLMFRFSFGCSFAWHNCAGMRLDQRRC